MDRANRHLLQYRAALVLHFELRHYRALGTLIVFDLGPALKSQVLIFVASKVENIMSEPIQKQQGLYFEEFGVGLSLETRGRTITETDVVNFAGLSGDFNPMHTNAEYSKNTPFGKRVSHGLLGLSIASGLSYQMGFMEGTVLAFTGVEWKFRAPIFIGDTIRVQATVKKVRAMKAAGGGFVTLDVKVLNQDDEVTQKGEWTVLMASKPEDEPETET
jgi:3-hydroxybutyryl-CoA dehydratase